MIKRLSIAAFSLLLVGCTASVSPEVDESETEAATQKKPSIMDWFADPEEDIAAQDLNGSYESAITVRDIMLVMTKDLESEARNVIAPVLQSFSNDLDSLKFYVELADREPLSEEENKIVADLTADIDEAMLLFSQVLELLL